MARVELHIDQDPAHVRVVRLVSAALGRMAGLGDEMLHEVRLGVSEACGLALDAHRAAGVDERLSLEFHDHAGLEVTVRTAAELLDPTVATVSPPVSPPGPPGHREADPGAVPPGRRIVLDRIALIEGLIDDVDIDSGPDGSAITMRWKQTHPEVSGHPRP